MTLRKLKRGKIISVLVVVVLILGFITFNKEDKTLASNGCSGNELGGYFDESKKLGFFEGKLVRPIAYNESETAVLSAYATDEKWIEVDLSEQQLRAWEGDKVVLQTPVSTGLPWWPTPTGEFRIWIKLRYSGMQGGEGRYYYNLPNVPYVMFFENDQVPSYKGYGLHGTYWHNDFGSVRSHGCVNLPTDVAGKLFNWVTPATPGVNYSKGSTNPNPGTRIVIHE